jgi:hypothetical protein
MVKGRDPIGGPHQATMRSADKSRECGGSTACYRRQRGLRGRGECAVKIARIPFRERRRSWQPGPTRQRLTEGAHDGVADVWGRVSAPARGTERTPRPDGLSGGVIGPVS